MSSKETFGDKSWDIKNTFKIISKIGYPWNEVPGQIFLSIFSAPLVIIPQGEQKSLSSSYRKSENGVDTDLPCSPNALKLKEDTRVLLIISTKNRLAGALLLCFKIHKSEKNHLLKASFLGQKLKLNILWLLVKHEVFWLELEDHWYALLFRNEVFYCLFEFNGLQLPLRLLTTDSFS